MVELIKKITCIHKWKKQQDTLWGYAIYKCTKCEKKKEFTKSKMKKL